MNENNNRRQIKAQQPESVNNRNTSRKLGSQEAPVKEKAPVRKPSMNLIKRKDASTETPAKNSESQMKKPSIEAKKEVKAPAKQQKTKNAATVSSGEKHLVRISKFILYIVGKILAVFIVLMLASMAFTTAENSAQVFMTARDAFTKRASVIMNPDENPDKNLLDGIFTADYLAKTGLKTENSNASYIISAYDQSTKVPVTVVWSWLDKIDIECENIISDPVWKFDETVLEKHDVDSFIDSGKYVLHFVKSEDNRWRVDSIELIELVDDESLHPMKYSEYVKDDVNVNEGQVGTAEEDPVPSASPEAEEKKD